MNAAYLPECSKTTYTGFREVGTVYSWLILPQWWCIARSQTHRTGFTASQPMRSESESDSSGNWCSRRREAHHIACFSSIELQTVWLNSYHNVKTGVC